MNLSLLLQSSVSIIMDKVRRDIPVVVVVVVVGARKEIFEPNKLKFERERG
jgi:hypothetical protein